MRLAGGTYALAREVRFGLEDSGTSTGPITYTAEGPEPVVLDGVSSLGFHASDFGSAMVFH